MPEHARRPAPAAAVRSPTPPANARARSDGSNQDRLEALRAAGTEVAGRVMGRGKGDIAREGTLTDPRGGGAVPLDRAMSEAKANGERFGDWLMARYGFQPGNTAKPDGTLRVFSPGLNTPEPVASERTAYYAEQLGQPMIHLHNGSNKDAGIGGAEQIDYATALATRGGLKSTPLLASMVTLLRAALSGAEPQDVHAILYSDSTIAGTRAIGIVRAQMIDARQRKGTPPKAAEQEVDALLREHLFVELHGNVAADLPRGPRYVAWTDKKDTISHGRPFPGLPEMGFSGQHKDRDADALYVDYDGPYGGADAHNLQAVGVHAVRQTWAANGVRDSRELFDKNEREGGIRVPSRIEGDAGKLWNPRNDPKWGASRR